MQKCRDWIRRKDNRKKLLLPVLFFLFLMIGSLLCLLWLQLLNGTLVVCASAAGTLALSDMVLRGVRCLPVSVCSCCRSCCSALSERRSKCSFLCFRSGPSTVQIRFLPNNRAVFRCSRLFQCCICSVRFCCYSLRYMVLFVIVFADRRKKPSGHRRFF